MSKLQCFGESGRCQRKPACEHACDMRVSWATDKETSASLRYSVSQVRGVIADLESQSPCWPITYSRAARMLDCFAEMLEAQQMDADAASAQQNQNETRGRTYEGRPPE